LRSVRPVSNLHSGRNVSGDDAPSSLPAGEIRLAHRQEIHAALQLILSSAGRPAAEEHIVDFLRFSIYRGINLADTWIAADTAGKLVWAVLPVISPGRTMLLFTPTTVPSDYKDTLICPLVERALEHHRNLNVDLAQVLLDGEDAGAVRLFEACSFETLAELVYLDREVRHATRPELPPGFSWISYSAAAHDEFARAITATYEGSLDCPRLNGRRKVDDVIEGHKAAGEFDPALWFVLRGPTGPAGVLLLNRSTRTDSLELVYLGLAAPFRGRRLGDVLMQHALASATLIGSRRLSLAVDSQNAPALRLYKRHGLTRLCSRVALIRDLRTVEKTDSVER
jgi:mycothiol synthase